MDTKINLLKFKLYVPIYHVFKRGFDFCFSLFAFILLSPLLLFVSLLVFIFHGKPILFKQNRPGKDEKIFIMYKFRTMTNEKDVNGQLLPDEKRITNFGKFLRKTSIDELPELLNVVKGDMSLIGPRPLLIKYLPFYTENERKRHQVRPGITGLSQVNGRNTLNWENRLKLDVIYVENMSFKLDLKILFKTFLTVIRPSRNIGSNLIEDFDVYRKT
ncbi:MAG: sugar transferase [Candidatus Woesearchaeota archaeon]